MQERGLHYTLLFGRPDLNEYKREACTYLIRWQIQIQVSTRERLDIAHHEFLGRQEEVGRSGDATLVVGIVTVADEPVG